MHWLPLKKKYKKVEFKAKKIIRDSNQKHLVSYISELGTSEEMSDKLVNMFKASNANQILLLKKNLNDVNMDRG